jgi:hypothetical protein
MEHPARLGRDSNAEAGTELAPRSRADLDEPDLGQILAMLLAGLSWFCEGSVMLSLARMATILGLLVLAAGCSVTGGSGGGADPRATAELGATADPAALAAQGNPTRSNPETSACPWASSTKAAVQKRFTSTASRPTI